MWKGDETDILDAGGVAERWLSDGGMNYRAAHATHPSGSALVCAKAWLIESHVGHLMTMHLAGVVQCAIPSETPELALLLFWKRLGPAEEGWSNGMLTEALRELIDLYDEVI